MYDHRKSDGMKLPLSSLVSIVLAALLSATGTTALASPAQGENVWQGLACGVGLAIAAKLDQKSYRVFVAVGDGECNEGEIWEACQTAYKYQLDNLVVFVDYNNLQLDGTCDEIMPPIDLGAKFRAFGFDVYEINGNDMGQMVAALDLAEAVKNGRPKCIFGHTIKGKGISFMENQCGWHGVAPNDQEYQQAMAELDQQYVKC